MEIRTWKFLNLGLSAKNSFIPPIAITNFYGMIPIFAFSREKSHEHQSAKSVAIAESDVITHGKLYSSGKSSELAHTSKFRASYLE
jgi:hypothetical protein